MKDSRDARHPRPRRSAARAERSTAFSAARDTRPEALRVVIAARYPLVRLGLRWAIATDPGLDVVGEASTGPEAVDVALRNGPDVVVLDCDLPDWGAAEAIRQIRGPMPLAEGLVLLARGLEESARLAHAAGARGFVLKTDRTAEIPAAIRSLGRHRPYCTQAADEVVRAASLNRGKDPPVVPPSDLSPRERQVLRLVAEGRTSKEIALGLGISPKTVDVHRGSLMKKLDIHSVANLVRYAICTAVIDV